MLRGVWQLLVSLGWVGAALAFSALSIGAVIGIAFLLRVAFPFLPNAVTGLALLAAFFLYIGTVGWVAWQIFKKRYGL